MKHLKKFLESKNSDVDILKEYFFNIIDDLEEICDFEIVQNNDNYFTVKISTKLKITNEITQDSTNLINSWVVSNTNSNKILQELKSSISRLEDENIIENFTLKKYLSTGNTEAYILEIYTKLKDNEQASNWIFVEDDYSVWVDGLRLKKYMNLKFDVPVRHFELNEDYDKYNERYRYLTIYFTEPVQKSKLQEIKDVLLEKEVDCDGYHFRVFTECDYMQYRDTAGYITFILNNSIIEIH